MGNRTKPKEQFVQLKPQGKGRSKIYSVIERAVDRAHIDCIKAPAGIMATAKFARRSSDLQAALLGPRKGHEPIELSKRGSAAVAEALRKERRKRAKLPSQQSKHGVDYSKPLSKAEAK